jgi:hypothetical protein
VWSQKYGLLAAWLLQQKEFKKTMMMRPMKHQQLARCLLMELATTAVWASKYMWSLEAKKGVVLTVYWPRASQRQQRGTTSVFIWTRTMVAPSQELLRAYKKYGFCAWDFTASQIV